MTMTRKTLEAGLILGLVLCQQAVAQEPQASNLLGRFRFVVNQLQQQGTGDRMSLPLTGVNQLMGGQTIVLAKLESYIDQKKEDRKNAWIAFYALSPKVVELGHNGVYDDNGAPVHPDWRISDNGGIRILGVVFSHKKWSDDIDNKIQSALSDPDYLHFITQLANFADLKAEEDTINKAVASWEESRKEEPLVALLDEFASRYRFDASRLDKGDPALLRLNHLVRAVTPALMDDHARDSEPSRARRVARSVGSIAGSAASVGVPFASLIKGLTTLATNVSIPFKKIYDVEPVLIRKEDPDNITLYSLSAPSKPHDTVYLGALLTSVEKPRSVKIESNQHLPIGRDALLHLERSIPQLHRAHAWRLVNTETKKSFEQISVSRESLDALKLNWEPKTDLPELPNEGRYTLQAAWDWDGDPLNSGEFRLHSVESGDVKVRLEPENPLIAGRGPARVELEANDFQFVEKVELYRAPDTGWEQAAVPLRSWERPSAANQKSSSTTAGQLHFRLSNRDADSGKQPELAIDLDTRELSAGFYQLAIASSGKTTTNADLTIYPPDPKILNGPFRINRGSGAPGTLALQGTGLDWICGISSDKLTWELHEDPRVCDLESWPSAGLQSKRTAAVSLDDESDFKEGDCLPFQLQLLSRTGDRSVSGGCVEVVGPRPSIVGHERRLPPAAALGLKEGEIPTGVHVGFSIRVENLSSPPSVELGCVPAGKPFQAALTVGDGQNQGVAALSLTGNDALFLSLDPGGLYVPDCVLTARLNDRVRGLSNSYALGKVIPLPRIERFAVKPERVDDQVECSLGNQDTPLYEGVLTGDHLHRVARTGWNEREGCPVVSTAIPSPTGSQEQTLSIAVPWPPPEPNAPLFIWLHGEETGRATPACVIDPSGCP